MAELPPIRRIITGHKPDGTAHVLIDGPATNQRRPPSGTVSTLMWCTDQCPADNAIGDDAEDMGARILGTPPPPRGTRFTVNDFPPGNTPHMHRTETVDYVIVLHGEIDMDMDEGSVTLRAGDIMVQRGTNHAWANRGTETARVAFVLIDAEPLGIGTPVLGSGVADPKPGAH